MSTKKTTTKLVEKPIFAAALAFIDGRGRAPIVFLQELLTWGKTAPEDAFSPDKLEVAKASLGKQQGTDANGEPIFIWDNAEHRRAALLEMMRVQAGWERTWGEGFKVVPLKEDANLLPFLNRGAMHEFQSLLKS